MRKWSYTHETRQERGCRTAGVGWGGVWGVWGGGVFVCVCVAGGGGGGGAAQGSLYCLVCVQSTTSGTKTLPFVPENRRKATSHTGHPPPPPPPPHAGVRKVACPVAATVARGRCCVSHSDTTADWYTDVNTACRLTPTPLAWMGGWVGRCRQTY